MRTEIVVYVAPDGAGTFRKYGNVRKVTCPNGCSTGFYDFGRARLLETSDGGPAPGATRVHPGWTVATLFVAVGLVVLYALFMVAVSMMPIPAVGVRLALWALLTLLFAGVAALLWGPAGVRRFRQPASAPVASPQVRGQSHPPA